MITFRILFLLLILLQWIEAQTNWDIVLSNKNELVIEVNTILTSPDDLKPIELLIGLPTKSLPQILLQSYGETGHGYEISREKIKTEWIHNQIVNGLNTGTLRISPSENLGSYFKRFIIRIPFEDRVKRVSIPTLVQKTLLAPKILNWKEAQHWIEPRPRAMKKIQNIPDGIWINLSLRKDGMYKLTGKEILDKVSSNTNLDPRSLMLFTSSAFGRDRTYELTNKLFNEYSIPENLVELAITIQGESDGNLGNDDILYFYAHGPSGFDQTIDNVSWHQNLYFTESNYWLLIPSNTTLRGNRVQTANIVQDGPLNIDYGLSYLHFETDIENPQGSGLAWGNTIIRQGGLFSQTVNLTEPVSSTTAHGLMGMIGKESVSTRYGNTKHKVEMSLGDKELVNMTWSNLGMHYADFIIGSGVLVNGDQTFKITNNGDNPNSEPLFDFLTLSYTRKLNYQVPFEFFSPIQSNDMTFNIMGSELKVWNITYGTTPENLPLTSKDNITSMRVTLPADTLQHFITFKIIDLPSPTLNASTGPIELNRLRNTTMSANHIIIGPHSFSSAAAPLVKHRTNMVYVSLSQIYLEFSGGNHDPIAIRHFLQWTQENWTQKPTTVLFLGDADFDYRNITGLSNIQVPTIEVGTNYSHATDDRLVAFNGIIPEMATGRFPARSPEEVTAFVEKIISFETNIPPGTWKQRITLVADDPARPERESYELLVGKSHTNNSERLAKLIPDFIEINKLYMVDYPEVNDGSTFGVTKPSATQALFDQIYSGTALINFIGHGNATQWAQEKLLIINENRNDILSIKANMKLPIWVAGTCNWGHFDAIGKESFAEELLRSEMDGASAIITTTRGITVSSNIQYLERIFGEIFNGDSVTQKTLGSVLQSVKTGGPDGELFHLFGDPAMRLPIPSQLIKDSKVTPDTLETLAVGTLSGTSPFEQGEGYIIFQDGPSTVTKSFNYASSQEEITYLQNGPILFRGSFTFSNSTLSPKFRVPKDITYTKNPAKVRFNISGLKNEEAIGSVSGIPLSLGKPSNDTDGPIITFETESGRILRSGDHLPSGENLIIRLSDPLGINLTGEKGHELMVLDPLTQETKNVIDQFIYDTNSLKTGTIPYKVSIESDVLSLHISAWDNANNPTETQIDLILLKSNILDLLHVLNFPNPFSRKTQFTFELTNDADITVDIYTLAGRLIKSIHTQNYTLGYHRIAWDGRDEYGSLLANGVYLYKMTAEKGTQKIKHFGRLAIYR